MPGRELLVTVVSTRLAPTLASVGRQNNLDPMRRSGAGCVALSMVESVFVYVCFCLCLCLSLAVAVAVYMCPSVSASLTTEYSDNSE